MLRIVLILLVGLWASAANAADKIAFGPPPAWVKPAPESRPGPLPQTGPAVRYLRYDEQLSFSPEGESAYVDRIAQVRTALGLSGVGTVTFTWDPARESVTVHKVRLIRDGTSVDLLARQSFTIIRREANLEQVVDGRLTATLQPEDLRVGDILEVAYTTTFSDPVMQGHADFAVNLGGMRGIEALSLRASWPTAQSVAWRAGAGLDKPKVGRLGARTELVLDAANLPELKGPEGAPARYWPSRDLEFSSFQSWAEVASTLAPLFEKAATLTPDSPLKDEAAKIRAASNDPKSRAAAALKLVQDKVRYLGLVLSDGGYTPVEADRTWTRRFGECKAKAVLLVALLRELGIKAEPALVNAYGAQGLDGRLPRMSAFNHVIVRAEIDGKVYWLDGTRTGDESIDALDTPPHDWALPIRGQGSQLIALVRTPRARPDTEIAMEVDATGGIEAAAPVKGEMIMRGEAALFPKLLDANMPVADRDKMLKSLWSRYPGIEVKSVGVTHDPQTGESRITMQGTAKLRWYPSLTGAAFLVPEASLGWRAAFKRDPGPGSDAPFAVAEYPSSTAYRLTLKLPLGGAGFSAPAPDVDKEVAGRGFYRRTTLASGVLTIETRTRALRPEFPASEAKAAAETLSEMANTRVYVTAPTTYRPTPGDIAAWQAQEPKTVQELITRGNKYGGAGKFTEALADFEKALTIDPKSSWAYSGRGAARLARNDLAGARADYEKAISLEDRNALAHFGLGGLAAREGRLTDAVAAFTRAAYLLPSNAAALTQRAEAYRQLGDLDRALADTDEVLRTEPRNLPVRYSRMQIHTARRDYAGALAEMDAAIAAAPDDPLPLIYRGALLVRMDRREDAERAFVASVAVKPTITAYLTRAANRPKTDVAARLADVAAAEKLEPASPEIPLARARTYADAGRLPEALQVLNRAAKANPVSDGILEQRAWVYAKSGQTEPATKDFAAWRAKAGGDPTKLNALCWTQATLGVALEMALADCAAALQARPKSAEILDSEGFVLLRLGRLKDSVDAYDAAIQIVPQLAQSLYGRGLAKLRLGKVTDGEADIAAARTASAKVEEEFAEYGVTR